jgi:hypothetical protein
MFVYLFCLEHVHTSSGWLIPWVINQSMEGSTVDSTSGDEWGFKDKQGENDVTKKDCGDVTLPK